jgi:hypothetical protein
MAQPVSPVKTSADLTNMMAGLMAGLISGAVSPNVSNAVVKAGNLLVKVAEMEIKYANKTPQVAPTPLQFIANS